MQQLHQAKLQWKPYYKILWLSKWQSSVIAIHRIVDSTVYTTYTRYALIVFDMLHTENKVEKERERARKEAVANGTWSLCQSSFLIMCTTHDGHWFSSSSAFTTMF